MSAAAPRVVVLTRISDDRGDDTIPYQTQEAGCRRKVEALGGSVVAVLHDKDISGDRLKRPGLDEALRLIAEDQADALMTYATDRLARDQVGLALIYDQLRRAGGELLSATEDFDTSATGTFLRSAVAFAAELELEKIRERTGRGLHGRYVEPQRYRPGWKPLYGYTKVGTGGTAAYEVNPAEADIVRRVFEWTAGGQTRYAITGRLNAERVPPPAGGKKWLPSAVARILDRQVYWTGRHECWRTMTVRSRAKDNKPESVARPAEERYSVALPAFVDPAVARQAQEARKRNRHKTRRADRDPTVGILRYGFVRCAECGTALSVVPGRGATERYKCTRAGCEAPVTMTVPSLDAAVAAWVREVALGPVKAASRWVEVEDPVEVDASLLARLAVAEQLVADRSKQAATLAANLALVTGAAATVVADQLNALNGELESVTAERDAIAAELAAQRAPARKRVRRVSPATVIAQAVEAAVRAGWEAQRAWQVRDWANPPHPDPDEPPAPTWFSWTEAQWLDFHEFATADQMVLPPLGSVPGWHVWQAVLAALNVAVVLRQERSELPRWEATMTLAGSGFTLHAERVTSTPAARPATTTSEHQPRPLPVLPSDPQGRPSGARRSALIPTSTPSSFYCTTEPVEIERILSAA